MAAKKLIDQLGSIERVRDALEALAKLRKPLKPTSVGRFYAPAMSDSSLSLS
jgi:hypothetical protein